MRRLGDVAELISGQHVNAEHVNSAGIGNPYLTGPSDFDAGKPRATKWTKHGKAFCEPGDILITVKGSGCGTMAIADRRYVISRQLMAIRPLNIHVGFLWATLSREIARLNAMSSGTIPGLTRDQILKIPIPHFSHKVQRWIGDLDNLLTRLQQCLRSLIAAKREFQRGLMQELLTGRRRFPEFQHDPRPTVALGEVTIINPDTLPESTDDYFRFRYIDISSVSEGRVTIPVSAIAFRDAPSRARRIVRQYDVLFSTVRPYLKGFAIVEDDRRDLVCSTGFAVLRAATKADAQYLLEVLFSDVVGRQVHARLVGSSFPALNSDDVANIRIPWPSAPERAKISHVLRAIRREIHLLEEMRARFETAKRGLMQKLLTGELTVPVSSEPEPVHA